LCEVWFYIRGEAGGGIVFLIFGLMSGKKDVMSPNGEKGKKGCLSPQKRVILMHIIVTRLGGFMKLFIPFDKEKRRKKKKEPFPIYSCWRVEAKQPTHIYIAKNMNCLKHKISLYKI